MKILKNNIIKLLFGLLIFASFTSCDEGGNPDAGGTTTEAYAGDWFITITDAAGKVQVDHALHATYNTAANDNTMWVDDWTDKPKNKPVGWYLMSKITVNLENGTFSAPSQANLNDPGSTVTITDGKFEKGAGLSKSGKAVDKISFKATFSYAPSDVLTFTGVKRTGFLEDEY
ncbi:hypothetical protein FFWV33_07435 [Flavobacterium faecale]|uniref:Lipid-binding hydrolase n=1 Tax=Flavobacterium faecale TaxID=1355330 RepID=A0A2S1LC87_9FLAO|nr:lipid-binding protein [Flavobacterium faecale]AWG21369.1 hypothetical protein FFWV33_07435 [Flavobacterium faecale]